MPDDEDATDVHGRVQAGSGVAAGGERQAADAGGLGVGCPALDAAQLAGRAARGGGVGGLCGPARPGAAAPAPSAAHAEIRRLRKELERAQMERDILKKAIGIFSGPPR